MSLQSFRWTKSDHVTMTSQRVVRSLLWICTILETLSLCSAVCPPKCNCNDETLVVICNSTNLDMVPITLNPGVQRLYLTHNNIRSVITTLGFYKDLESLDLSRNQLSHVETRAFDAQEKLQTLRLSYNSIEDVSNDTFLGLRTLKVLQLDNNKLQTLLPRVFVHLRSLEKLDLNNNKISKVSSAAFDGLTSLRILHLRGNRLVAIPTPSFAPLGKLNQLDLSENSLGTVPPKAFAHLRSLRQLALNGCGLKEPLPNAAFEGLGSLINLLINKNSLRSIPAAFASLERLERIEMGENYVEELPAHSFKGLRYLRIVDISGDTRLHTVRRYAFSANVDLERVYLTNNPRFDTLEAGAFEGLSGLRVLSLRGNSFTSFSELLLTWEELDTLDLQHNPLHCNCSLLWLRDLLNVRNMSDDGSVATCQTPSALDGRNVADLSIDDLSCFFNDMTQQALVGIAAAVVIACVATLVVVALKYRRRVTSALKDKWSDGALRRKEHQYEKTNDEDENNILYATAQQPMKMTPVTEL